MQKFDRRTNIHARFCIIVIFISWLYLRPFLQFYLDADSVAYMSIAQRYGIGDFSRAINGMWSPLQEWLIAPFMSSDLKENFETAQSSNLIIAMGTFIAFASLLSKTHLSRFSRIAAMWIMVPCLIYFSFFQIFGDLLSVMVLLFIIRVLVVENLAPWHLALLGVLGALSYFAKSYNFFYFPLLILISFLWKSGSLKTKAVQMLYIFASFGIAVYPWLRALHDKYGMWTSSVSGKLNSTWYLVHQREYNEKYELLIPPIYKNSTCFWEDPIWVQGALHTAFESWDMFTSQLARIVHTTAAAVIEVSLISPLIFCVYVALIFFIRRNKNLDRVAKLCVIVLISLPLGYLFVHIESRYIWLLGFVGIILLFHLIDFIKIRDRMSKYWVTLFIALSFWAYPLFDMEKLWLKGKEEYDIGQLLQEYKLTGRNVISNLNGGDTWKTSFWSNNKFYETPPKEFDNDLLLKEIEKFDIDMILYYSLEPANSYEKYLQICKSAGFRPYISRKNVRIFIRDF